MKMDSLKSMVRENRWRPAVVLFAFVALISLATTLGLSQVKSQKRVTALQLGDAAEGARVTIVSDSALNDYEAFRRGDRFYVKIPLADFAAASPNFRGNGFEDVRVQKVGDSVIVSFKLQPGATARVDQRSNRLDVIFSAAGMGRTVPPVNAVKSFPTSRNRRNAGDSDASAGPVPLMSGSSSAASRTNDYSGPSPDDSAAVYRETPRGSRSGRRNTAQTSTGQTSKGNAVAGNLPAQTNAPFPTSTASPVAASSPFSTPAASTAPTASTPSTASTTPVTTPVASSSQNPYGVPVSAGQPSAEATSWDSRIKFVKAWAKLNRNALIVGGVVALALLAALLLRSRRKGSDAATAKSSTKEPSKPVTAKAVDQPVAEKAPAVTPVAAAAPTPASTVAAATPGASPSVASVPAPTPTAPPRVVSTPTPRKEVWSPQPAQAGFAAAAVREPRDADQDREVFEL